MKSYNMAIPRGFHRIGSFLAKTISYIFHPLFIPTYFFILLLNFFPYEFPSLSGLQLELRVFNVFWMTAFFPFIAVFIMWRLKMVDNLFLKTQKERIIPFFINMFFYWWMFYLSRNFGDQPAVLQFFYLGIFFSTIIGVIANNFFKISLHAMGMGSVWMAVLFTAFYYKINWSLVIVYTTLITGLVCTARLYLGHHTTKDIYMGLMISIICQCLAFWVIT